MEDFYFKKFRKIANSIWEAKHQIDTPDISGEETNIDKEIEYTFSLSGAMNELEEDEKKKYEEYIKIWSKKFEHYKPLFCYDLSNDFDDWNEETKNWYIDIITTQKKNNPLIIWHENTNGTKIILGLIDMQNKRIVK